MRAFESIANIAYENGVVPPATHRFVVIVAVVVVLSFGGASRLLLVVLQRSRAYTLTHVQAVARTEKPIFRFDIGV